MAVAVFAHPVLATPIYLAPHGSDYHIGGDNSRDNPFKTLRYAASNASLGHAELVMLAGAYPNEGNADLTFSSRQLDISAEGIVTIDCSGRPGLTLERGDYKLRGLRWRACDGALTIRQASASLDNCVISACQASGSRASAIQAFDSSLVLQNCSLDHNKGSVHGVQHAARHTPHATRRTPHAARRTPHAARRTPADPPQPPQ